MRGNFSIEIEVKEDMLNDGIQKVISKSIKSLDIDTKVTTEVIKRIGRTMDKSFKDGTFLCAVAKNVASKININDVIALIDIDELKEIIANRIANNILNKIQ